MGLRCLLGHDFGEPETERERTEEGNEVVVTVREVKTCQRCGEKQVVSENKEITSIEQLRESATRGSSPTEPSSAAGSGASTAEEWGADELSSGPAGADPESGSGVDEAETADSEPTEPSPADGADADEDPIERGVADIIEQAERDDDMLQGPSEPPEADDEPAVAGDDEDVPVHPGQRSAAAEESEIPDAEEDDGVILDEDDTESPENARKQWEDEAAPEDVPGGDSEIEDSPPPEDADAEIIDAEPEPSEPDAADGQAPSAVASEDTGAEIIDAESEPSEREETDEGHMPWPDAPGTDEGHDATVPDGDPADIDFGKGIATDDDGPESTASSTDESDPADPDNGGGTPTGEPADASAAPTANVDLERSSRDAELEYYCPECGLTRGVGNSSMRAGDICPECRVGYITERERTE